MPERPNCRSVVSISIFFEWRLPDPGFIVWTIRGDSLVDVANSSHMREKANWLTGQFIHTFEMNQAAVEELLVNVTVLT
jgi:hypothetical protein